MSKSKSAPETIDTDPPFTHEEYDAHIRKMRDALAPAPLLAQFLARHHPEGEFQERLPIGLIGTRETAPGETGDIVVQPFLTCRPHHLIVSEETAAAFELTDLKIANACTNMGGVPIPLDTFSIRYYADQPKNALLYTIQRIDCPTVSPANRVIVQYRNAGKTRATFRGILWAATRAW